MKYESTYLRACEANNLHSFPALKLSLAILVELAAYNRYWPDPCGLPHYAVRSSTRHVLLDRLQAFYTDWVLPNHERGGIRFFRAVQTPACDGHRFFVSRFSQKVRPPLNPLS
jgi:hypothetical protein